MKFSTPHSARIPAFVLAVTVPLLLAGPAFAQKGGGHGGGGSHSSVGGGGHAGGGGSHASGGGRTSGGSHSSGGSSSGSAGSAGTRVAAGSSGSATATSRVGASTMRTQDATRGGTDRASRTLDGTTVPPGSRPIDGHTPIGTAVPRGSSPVNTALFVRTGSVVSLNPVFGYYPGFGYYYGYPGYYPFSSLYFDPWYADSWYGGFGPMAPVSSALDDGAIHLKITPREAQVYVDGAYVGIVDDFDGILQKLRLPSGTHHLEVRADGYEALSFDIQVPRDHAVTYRGALQRIQ